MENEYKFLSKFIEGKTYKELTPEELEKLKSGVGVKKEDKEYMESLEKDTSELKENLSNENVDKVEEPINSVPEKQSEKLEEVQENYNIDDNVNENTKENKNGVKVIQAMGKTLKLEDKRTVILSKNELKKKPFWRKGDVYYG